MVEKKKRSGERKKISLPISFKKRSSLSSGVVKNISKGGMFVETTRPLKKGDEGFFSIQTETGAIRFNIPGKVVWNMQRAGRKRKTSAGMGIEFIKSRFASPEVLSGVYEKAGI